MKYQNKNSGELKKKIKEAKLDALLITNFRNIKYLTGFSSLEGVLLVAGKDSLFFTGICELAEAKSKITSFKIKERKRGNWNFLNDFIQRAKIKRLGFEEEYLSVAGLKSLRKISSNCKLKGTSGIVEQFRAVKTPREIAKIKKAVSITEKIFTGVKKNLRPGLTELDVAGNLSERIAKCGLKPAFNPIVAFGAHTASPHAQPGRKNLKKGDLVLIDMGVDFEGYKSDMTRTFFIGRPNTQQAKIYNVVLEAKDFIQRVIKPGISIAEVEEKAHRFFSGRGWGKFFPHSVGHGIGLDVHERPFFSKKSKDKLVPGMVFTLEPAVYFPGWGGVRIEDLYLVTRRSCQKLSQGKNNDFSR